MNLRLHISFLSAGLLAASSMALVFFFGNGFHGLPLRVRIHSLWSPMPMFLLAGALAGWGCGRGWRSIIAFGLASLLPGFWIPTAMMGTQGAHGTVDLFLLTTGVPTVTYLFVGMIGGYVSFRSLPAAISVAAGFAIGAILGPVLAWLLRPMTEFRARETGASKIGNRSLFLHCCALRCAETLLSMDGLGWTALISLG